MGIVFTTPVFTTVALNLGTLTGFTNPAGTNTWVSDKKYVMWKEGSANTANATDFT